MADYGIKIAMPGTDIYSTDPTDYTVWSKHYNLKFLDQDADWPGSITVPANAYDARGTVTHDLGYLPLFDFYFQALDGGWHAIPGKSDDVYNTSGFIWDYGTSTIEFRVGGAGTTVGTARSYPTFFVVHVDPNA